MKKRSEEEREEKFKPCFRKVLEKWLGPKDNWEEEFDSIDMTNKKGEDAVLFVVLVTNINVIYLKRSGP